MSARNTGNGTMIGLSGPFCGMNAPFSSSSAVRVLLQAVCFGFFFAIAAVAAEPAQPSSEASATRNIVFFGDSLTAGYGLDDPSTESYPALIQKKIDAAGLPWRVVNAGLSGETTSGGARRVEWILRQPVDLFVLALGGNDGLRGIDPGISRTSLQRIIDRVREKNPNAKIVLAGMMMPPTLGADYTRQFAAMYPELAKKNSATLLPFLLDGVGGDASLNQADQIHPNVRGHAVVAETVWKVIKPLLTP
jgi:acyl-CoA thioesterase-1